MKNLRIEYPRRRRLVGLLFHKDRCLVNRGDLFSVVKMPLLPIMRQTQTVSGPIGDYVDTADLLAWVSALLTSDYKTESRELQRLVDWARDSAGAFKPKAGARRA